VDFRMMLQGKAGALYVALALSRHPVLPQLYGHLYGRERNYD